ncbi:short-chain fatty acyl-CoA regulator family protein [Tessaracoccus sp. ZS01]|uniref:short-chain fatty acyl-CoA regulator family protein n=1 Tax=Tessaracoccus sp. ZS01 TaxID=1906324 RepID=UPI00096E4573|nr:short-chain fatty acyl-CoA regulator family protein [Tessaracoccus sp. ZS01]MCG6566851.1 ImmA/IrrE family metallo-endopeptidase [Tessaracoccus sp. ZS01]OMG57990.1 Cro/Cl family transcriptional regulator [Tessaracoccus sp. ZS01]
MEKVFGGARLRRLREERGLSQVELARVLVISPSYLNQIEHDTRPLTVTVLVRLTELFGIDPSYFSPRDTARQLAQLREALRESSDDEARTLPLSDLQQIARTMPEVTEAIVRLHRGYRDAVTLVESDTARAGGRLALMPHERVLEFFDKHLNYFNALDRTAERLAKAVGHRGGDLMHQLRSHLEAVHGVQVTIDRGGLAQDMHAYDERHRTLVLAPDLREGQQAFRMATQLAYLEAEHLLDEALATVEWPDETSRTLARIGLAHYFAAALVLPYTEFFRRAERLRYDVEELAEHFDVGYETAAHRLSTLQRPGMRGVPLIFIRVDRAGNVSKRQSATGFHFSRDGGTCPLWNIYEAFSSPGQVKVQVAEMPDGHRYLWIARTVTHRRGGYGSPAKTFVIGLGCELRQAGRLIYSLGLDLIEPDVVPIGPGCRTCDRPRCIQRATPPVGLALRVDESRSSFAPYPLST